MNNVQEAISTLGLFSASEIKQIEKAGILVNIPQHWVPIAQGTPPDQVYLIVAGEASIRKNKVEVARLGAGSLIGETAHARRSLRTADVVAVEPVRALRFSRDDWRQLLANISALSEKVEELTLIRT